MLRPEIALISVALALQLYFVIRYLRPALRDGWRGRLAERFLWISIATSVAALVLANL